MRQLGVILRFREFARGIPPASGTEQLCGGRAVHQQVGTAVKPVYPENTAVGVESPSALPSGGGLAGSPQPENPGVRASEKPQAQPEQSSSTLGKQLTGPSAWMAVLLEEMYSLSYLTSAVVHVGLVLVLATLVYVDLGQGPDIWLEGTFERSLSDTFDLDDSLLGAEGGDFSTPRDSNPLLTTPGSFSSLDIPAPSITPRIARTEGPTHTSIAADAAANLLASRGGGLSGRDPANRRRLALGGGGSEASEAAVELGLQWLAEHQAEHGGWSFKHDQLPQCNGACRDPGFLDSTTGSTGLALLCFLGAGYTQNQGPYQDVVANGLYYLVEQMVVTSDGGDLRGLTMLDRLGEGSPMVRKSGDMYSHGIATLAICEAAALSRDQNLKEHAQLAINFIVYAQNEYGGWRYEPKQPGDTTVSGWQVTALKSGLLGDMHIPREVWYKAAEYFDSVQDDRGATYGYQGPQTNRHSTSAVGLLCRMMLGWPKDHDPLLRGAARLAKEDPVRNNMYFNYYNSQVLHHVGGSGWQRWNKRMREHLVRTQAKDGHERGSWFVKEAWSDRGGRLYTTTLSILTLEVYYRYLPIYQDEIVDIGP